MFRNGVRAIIRNPRPDDAVNLYALTAQLSDSGRGFSIYEYPTVEFFTYVILADSYCMVIEEVGAGKLIGYATISNRCYYLRTNELKVGESFLVIGTEFHGKGYGKEIAPLQVSLMKELGFAGRLNDHLCSSYNLFANPVDYDDGGIYIGAIPKYAYREGVGWDDGLLGYFNFNDYKGKTFSDQIEENSNRFTETTSKL